MKEKNKKSKIKGLIQLIIIAVIILLFLVFCGKNEGLTVTFNVDGKEYHEINDIKKGNTIEEPKNPDKEGYSFAGWFFGEKEFNFDKPIDKNIKLDAKWNINEYTVTINTGTGSIINEQINYNDTISEPNIPSMEGYIFVGWYSNDEVFDFSTKVNGDLNIEARWTNQIYSTYKVEHYLMNQNGKYSDTPNEVENLTGKIGSVVTPSTKEYKGYNAPDIQDITVSADGKATVRYYYSINKYKLTLKGDNGVKTVTGDGEYFYNEKVDINYIIKDGYTLVSISEKLIDNTYTMIDEDVVIEFTTEQNKDTKYVVKHYKMNTKGKYNNTPSEIEELYGITDTNVTPSVKSYVGFTSPKTTTVNVDGDGKTVVKYYYERNKYELSLVKDKGISSVIGAGKYYFEEEITVKANVKDGYTFSCWSNNQSNTEFIYKIPANNTTINTSTTVNSYLISYNLDNGENGNNPTTYTVEDEIVLEKATKVGYTFTEWTGNNVENNKVLKGTTGDLEITANYTANTYRIILDKNNGEGQNQVIQTAYDKNTVLPKAPYTRRGYTFKGWSVDDDNTVEYVNEANITNISTGEDVTLYAVWEINTYNITYDLNNGINGNNPTTYTVEDEITLVDATKVGYTFTEWTGNNIVNGVISKGTIGNLEITANYEVITYNISYNLDNGTNGNNPTTYTVEDEITLVDATKVGYTFTEWTGNNVENNKVLKGTTGDLEITANYTANSYIVTYDANGGSVTPGNQTVTYDGTYGELPIPTKTGYSFKGWYLGTNQITNTTQVKTSDNHILVANWEVITYNISYNLNNGTNGNNPTTYTVEDEIILESATKVGYTFAGWTGDSNGIIPKGTTGDLEITANYEVITYNISYNLNNGTNGNNPTTYTVEDEIVLEKATKVGYTFTEWTGNNVENNKVLKGTTGDLEITANYTANTYRIILDKNNGEGQNQVIQTAYDKNTVLPKAPYTRRGYTFKGWSVDDDNTVEYLDEANITNISTGEDVTLYAVWEINTYNITYDLNNGINGNNPTTYTVEDEITLVDATKVGYTFAGWTGNSVVNGVISKGTIGNLEITANYIANSYVVTYDANGGNVTPGNKTVTYDATYGELPIPTKTGYSFKGWYLGINQITNTTQVKTTENHTLVADWSINKYTVTFNSNGGTYVDSIEVYYNSAITEPNAPTRIGHTFNGWYIDSEKFDFSTSMPATNIVLKAKWSVNSATIGFDTNGGSIIDAITQDYGTKVTAPNDPTKTGYTFAGWYIDEDLTQNYTFITMPAEGITVYAKWNANKYTVTYDANGGSVTPGNKTVTYDGPYGELPTPTRTGYEFNGWYLGTKEVTSTTQVKTSDNHILVASWEAKTYTVTYDANGGSVTPGNQTVTYDATYGELPTPTKTGYSFKGWYLGTNQITNTTQVKTADNHILVASWEVITYNISYNLNNGTNGNNPTTYTVEDEIILESATKVGYTFAGWTGDSNGIIPKGTTGDLEITANYEVITYNISYNLNNGTNGNNPTTYTVEDEIVLEKATKVGYTFTEWTGNNVENNKVLKGTTGDLEITANYTANTYRIILDKNNGEGQNQVIQTAYDKNTVLPKEPYTRRGYTFKGWSVDDDNTVEYVDEANITNISTGEDVTLYAVWEINTYNITYDLNNGINGNNPTTYTVEDEIILESATKVGYTFAGWTGDFNGIIPKGTVGDLTITANYEVITYNISYNLDNGTNGNNPTTYTVEDEITLVDATKVGYTFTEWTGNNVENNKVLKGTTGDLEITANYTANSYIVTYDANGGSVTPGNQTVTYDGTYGELPIPTKTGYSFKGWYLGTNQITNTTQVKTSDNHILVANWEVITYNISYNLNNGTNGNNPTTYTVEDEIILENATKVGYTFTGWTGNSVVNGVISKGTVGDLTITANYEVITYNISYNLNNGANGNNPTTYTVEDEITLVDATKVGYTFTEWTGNNVENNKILKGTTGDLEITANYTANSYIVTYDANGGSVTPGNQTVTYDGTYGELPIPTKTGYSFKGWYLGTNQITNTTQVKTSDNHILVASWEAKTYTVTYNANGGSVTPGNKIVTYDGIYGELPTPSRTGYEFTGWYYNGSKIYTTTEVKITNDHTLVADWTLITYNINYNLDNGIKGNNPTTYTVEDEIILENATKVGYTFTGWTGNSVVNGVISKGTVGDLTITANYEVITYNISYNLNNGANGNNPTTYTVEDEITLVDATKVGYTFTEWTGNNVENNKILKGTTGDLEITANYTANSYIVTYDANGGSVTPGNQTVTYDGTYGELPIPTKTGYSFKGWYLGTTEVTSTTQVKTSDNHILVADWNANTYKIILDKNTGEGQDVVVQTAYDKNTLLPANTYTKMGYDFKGWSTKEDGTVNYADKANVTNISDGIDIRLYAVWSAKSYTVTYNATGGSVNPTTTQVTYDSTYGQLVTPTRKGYTFTGWYTSDNGGTKIESTTSVTSLENHTLYAHWTINSYTVTYDATGGSINSTTKTITYGNPYGELPTPERDDYVFAGWYTSANGGTKIESTTILEIDNNHSIYAHWNIIPKIEGIWFDVYKKDTKEPYYSEMENNAYFVGDGSFYVRLPRDSSIDVKKIGIKTNTPVYINPENEKDTSGKYFEITASKGSNAGGPGKYIGAVELDAGIASDTILLKSTDGGITWKSEDSMSVTALEFKDVFTKSLSLAKGLAKSYEGEESPRYISTLVNDPELNYYFMFFKPIESEDRTVQYIRIEDGKEIIEKTIRVPKGSKVPKIDEYQVAGYTFNGWYIDKNFNNNINYYDVIVEENIKIYGNYERLSLDTTWYYEPLEGENKYCINDASDLKGFAYLVNNDKVSFQGKTVQLCKDIVLQSDYNWVPIDGFKGTFEGNLHTIKNLNINTATNQVGFFKSVSNVTIKNVIFENATINATSSSSVAVLVGEANATTFSRIAIKNSTIKGNQNTGGMIGTGKDITADQISIDNTTVAGGDRDAGGLAADLVITNNTTGYISLTNIYVNANITSNYSAAPDTGGVVGALYTPKGYDKNNVYNNFKLNNIIFTGSVKQYQACVWIICTYMNSFGAIYGRFGIDGNNNDELGPVYTDKSTLLYDKDKITLTRDEFLSKGTGYNTSYLQKGINYSTTTWSREVWYFDPSNQKYPTFTWLK